MAPQLTDAEKRRKDDIFHYLSDHPDYPKPLAVKQPEDKTPDAGSGEHTGAQFILKGNTAKGTHDYYFLEGKPKSADSKFYAWNAWNYIGSGQDKSRDIYGKASPDCMKFFNEHYKPNFYQIYPTDKIHDPDGIGSQHKALKAMGEKKLPQDKQAELTYLEGLKSRIDTHSKNVGCSLPYRWQAHHVVAHNFFVSFLSENEYRLVRGSDYDINHGRNIIFLPYYAKDTVFHGLPYHCSSHPDFDEFIQYEFRKIKKRAEQIADQAHGNADANIEKILHQVENNGFKMIRKIGPNVRLT